MPDHLCRGGAGCSLVDIANKCYFVANFVANVWRQRCSADAATGLMKASAGSLGPDQLRS